MLRLKDTRHQSTAGFLNSAIDIAEYYGFVSIDEVPRGAPAACQPSRAKEETPAKRIEIRRVPTVSECESEMAFARRDERALVATAKKCLACAQNRGTKLLWRHVLGSRIERSSIPTSSLELHVIGTSSAIAEALLIIVANAIAAEAGIKKRVLSINSIGSYDSSNRFVRDVGIYLRKHIDSISPTLRPRITEDPLGTLVQLIERGHPATSRAPQSMEYLTEDERRKFWDLLEYLEVFGLPYELNPQILGSRDCWAHSLFEISSLDEETGVRISLASGGRYDPIAVRFAPCPAAMISVNCEIRGSTRIKRGERPIPALYFAHLGPEARRRALSVLEMLRAARIPVYQSLMYERIGEQMAEARALSAPYILIMGHKEAVEGTILVREVVTNSQDAVKLPELTSYLKRHRVVTVA